MSRTIRRTRDKRRNKSGRSHFEKQYTYDIVKLDCGWVKVKLEGKEFDQAYWKFHSDTSNGYGWGNSDYDRLLYEKRCRSVNKHEIIKYYKDVNYEVFALKPRCLSWER